MVATYLGENRGKKEKEKTLIPSGDIWQGLGVVGKKSLHLGVHFSLVFMVVNFIHNVGRCHSIMKV
jgi:hypothetical protein